jgi:hypothetical protein
MQKIAELTYMALMVHPDVKSGAAKARYENGRSIRNVGESLCCGASSFVHRHRWYASLFEPSSYLEILSDLAWPFRKFYPGEFPCRELQKIPEAEADVAVQ